MFPLVIVNTFLPGLECHKIWTGIKESIIEVILSKEEYLIQDASKYTSTNFFEMMRFDFVVDSKLNVFLMEVTIIQTSF